MKVVVDIMSGEHPPQVLINGCIEALKQTDDSLILIGKENICKEYLKGKEYPNDRLIIEHCEDVIYMDEIPIKAIKAKPNSSIMKACRLLQEGKADALFSPGNTGATVAASLLTVGKVDQIKKIGIGITIPQRIGNTLLIDGGANVDCSIKHYVQFAILGHIFTKYLWNIEKPRIGLLNIGSEKTKGNSIIKKAYQALLKTDLNFIGNIEGNNLFDSSVDVVVCDGFIGNILLKSNEQLARLIIGEITEKYLKKMKIDESEITKSILNINNQINYGGAPLLGIKKTVVIGHGVTNDITIVNGIKIASQLAKANINKYIEKYYNK